MIDVECPKCGHRQFDVLLRDDPPDLPKCDAIGGADDEENPVVCGEQTVRVHLPHGYGRAIPDEIPGGLEIKHSLCNDDGTPRRYYSHSAIRKAAEAKGWTNYVVHQPPRDSDKSKHTVRWT